MIMIRTEAISAWNMGERMEDIFSSSSVISAAYPISVLTAVHSFRSAGGIVESSISLKALRNLYLFSCFVEFQDSRIIEGTERMTISRVMMTNAVYTIVSSIITGR